MSAMPTLSDNIEYIYRCKVEPNRASIVHLVKSLLVLVLVAVALEIFVFNFNPTKSFTDYGFLIFARRQ